jgi:hypothetical protein
MRVIRRKLRDSYTSGTRGVLESYTRLTFRLAADLVTTGLLSREADHQRRVLPRGSDRGSAQCGKRQLRASQLGGGLDRREVLGGDLELGAGGMRVAQGGVGLTQ